MNFTADNFVGSCMSKESISLLLLTHKFCFKKSSLARANLISQKLVEIINNIHDSISFGDAEIIIWLKKGLLNLILNKKTLLIEYFKEIYDTRENFNSIPEINQFHVTVHHPDHTHAELYEMLQEDPANFYRNILNDETVTRIQLHEINNLLQTYLDINKCCLMLSHVLDQKLKKKGLDYVDRLLDIALAL